MSTRNVAALNRVLRGARGPAWGLLDQAVYSGTNFLAVILVARALGADAFGAFALALSVWATVWVLARSVIAEPFIIRTAAFSEDVWRVEAAHAVGVILAAGTATGLGIAVVALVLTEGSLRPTLLALAPFIPALLLQDFWRVAAFSRDRGELAFVNDLGWAATQVGALALLWALYAFTAPTAMAAWALGGLAGVLIGFRQFRLRPHLSGSSGPWVREMLRLGGWLAVGRGIQAVGLNLVFVLVGAVAGLAALGELRAVYTLFTPLWTLNRAIQLPALARMSAAGPAALTRIVCSYALLLSLVAGGFAAAVVLGGSQLLMAVFGETFSHGPTLLAPVALTFMLSGLSSSAALALGALRAVRWLALVESVSSLLRVVLTLVLLARHGIEGAAWAMAVHSVVHACLVGGSYLKLHSSARPGQPHSSVASGSRGHAYPPHWTGHSETGQEIE